MRRDGLDARVDFFDSLPMNLMQCIFFYFVFARNIGCDRYETVVWSLRNLGRRETLLVAGVRKGDVKGQTHRQAEKDEIL